MGTGDAHEHNQFGDIVAVCDVDANRADAAKHDKDIGKGKAEAFGDYRKVLDNKDIDVVSVVTPDHWHVKIAIEALEAGKHVFSQKPLTLTLEENQLVRNAAKKFNKQVYFVGTQQRSDRDRFLRAVNMVHKGLLGDIKHITVGINGGPTSGKLMKTKPPKELDWDFWLGQAPKVDYIPRRCHYEFRWWYEYSGGKFTDWGAHHVDIATWAIQHDKEGMGPIEIDGTDAKHPVPFKDGYPTVDDEYNTATDFGVKLKYANGIEMLVDSRSENGILFEGREGPHLRQPRQDRRQADRREWDKDKFGTGRSGRALQRQAVRRPQGEHVSLHPRRRLGRVRRVQPRDDDEHLPSLLDRRPIRPQDPLGPESGKDRRRSASRRAVRAARTRRV